MAELDADYIAGMDPRARTVHLVMDNLNIHCEKSITDNFGLRVGKRLWRCLTVHFPLKHATGVSEPSRGSTLYRPNPPGYCVFQTYTPMRRLLLLAAASWRNQLTDYLPPGVARWAATKTPF